MDFKKYLKEQLEDINREQSEYIESFVASLMEKYDLNDKQAIELLRKYIKSLGF